VDEEGTYCLLGGIIKPGEKRQETLFPGAPAAPQPKALHAPAFLQDVFVILKKLYVVKKGSLAVSKY